MTTSFTCFSLKSCPILHTTIYCAYCTLYHISSARCTLTTHTTATSKDNDKDSALGEVIGDTVNVARLWTDIAYILLGQVSH